MCDPAHRPAVASGSDHPPARANDVLLPLGHAHWLRTLGGVGKCDRAATKLTIFNVWVLLKKKKVCWSLGQLPDSVLALYPGLATSGPLHCPPPACDSLPQRALWPPELPKSRHGPLRPLSPTPCFISQPCRLALCPSAVCLLSGQARSPRARTLLLSMLHPSILLLVERMHQEGGVSPALHVAQPRM